MPPTVAALALAVPLILLSLASGGFQLRGMQALAARKLVPSDERAYLAGRHRRRLIASAIMLLAGLLIAGAYLSGMEARADAIAAPTADGQPRAHDETDRQFVRFYGVYWIVVIVLACLLVAIACADGWATRRYWLGVLRHLRDDHQTQLRRDLAVYKQQHDRRRTTGRDEPEDDG